MLSCAVTFRNAELRSSAIECKLSSPEEAIELWTSVLLHEAKESMQDAMTEAPIRPFMHPVDVDTDEPGVVDQKEDLHVMRRPHREIPRVHYLRAAPRPEMYIAAAEVATSSQTEGAVRIDRSTSKATQQAAKDLEKFIAKNEKSAAAEEKRLEVRNERKLARENETADQRQERLEEAKKVRDERKKRKEEDSDPPPPTPPKNPKRAKPLPTDEAIACPDATQDLLKPVRQRVPGARLSFFEHPLPAHRHLQAVQKAFPSASLLPALLKGEHCKGLMLIKGPPGTGKTHALINTIHMLPSDKRVLVCAPTNVGAVNLYARCISTGFEKESSLILAPERTPPGTVVLSNDPTRRIVCATISSRAGALDAHDFDAVLIDEAGQCMEAVTWGLFRPDVEFVALAGDVKQLPACASASGKDLNHQRSLMERLILLNYSNSVELEVQHRIAPELLSFPNQAFYEGRLSCGEYAPDEGEAHFLEVEDAREEAMGTSFLNRKEVEACETMVELLMERSYKNIVVISPYAAQCRALLAKGMGVEVHTIDSFQGREADAVVLSCVRDGRHGMGFWSDDRRLTVASTRAKTFLCVVGSGVEHWPPNCMLRKMYDTLPNM